MKLLDQWQQGSSGPKPYRSNAELARDMQTLFTTQILPSVLMSEARLARSNDLL